MYVNYQENIGAQYTIGIDWIQNKVFSIQKSRNFQLVEYLTQWAQSLFRIVIFVNNNL